MAAVSEQSACSLRTYMETMDDSKKRMLRELREKLKNELKPEDDDFLLLRFLKARSFDFTKGEKMLRDNLKFRKKLEFEMKDFQPHEVFQKYFDYAILGVDKQGDPITYGKLSSYDFKGISYSVSLIDQIKFYLSQLNKHHDVSKKPENERVGSFIMDCENISMAFISSTLVIRHHMNIIQLYQANFPETLKTCFVINDGTYYSECDFTILRREPTLSKHTQYSKKFNKFLIPSFFHHIFNCYKNAIDANIIQKLQIYGKDGYQEALLKIVDADILPACFGGKRTDPDGNPDCVTMVRREFLKIPTSYYMNANDDSCREPGMDVICIRERSSYDHRVRIDIANSTIKWYFHTENYNVKFGMFFVSDDVPQTPKLNRKYSKVSNKTLQKVGYDPLFPVEFAESHVIPERGEYICEKTGTYVLRFDNSFSWVTSKQLNLKVDVLVPKLAKQSQKNGYHK